MLNSAQLRKQAGGACLEQINVHIYRRVVPGRSAAYENQALLGDWRVFEVTLFAALVSSLGKSIYAAFLLCHINNEIYTPGK